MRGWSTEFLVPWDGGDTGISRCPLVAWDMVAEFLVTPAAGDFAEGVGYLYVSTDQVRFHRPTGGGPPSAACRWPMFPRWSFPR
jgi:hypothetical protein